MRDCFSFYRSFLEAIDELPPDIQAEIYPAIARYALNDITPTALSPIANCVFTLIKPIIDSNNKKRDNGAKGGAPLNNKNAQKKTTRNNQKQPKVESLKQPETTKKQPNNVNCYNILSTPNRADNNSNINNKDDGIKNNSIIINNDGDVDDVAKSFFEKISDAHFVRHARKALSISAEEFLQHAKVIIAEWKISSVQNFLPENTPEKHLINQVRIKRDLPAEIKAQASTKEREARQLREKQIEQKLKQESAEPRGAAALAALRRSKGLADGDSVFNLITSTSEADAIRDARVLIVNRNS